MTKPFQFILVAEKVDVTESYQLGKSEQLQLTEESCFLAENLAVLYRADKMNIAAIGKFGATTPYPPYRQIHDR